jgi:hypothetical protein
VTIISFAIRTGDVSEPRCGHPWTCGQLSTRNEEYRQDGANTTTGRPTDDNSVQVYGVRLKMRGQKKSSTTNKQIT